MLGKGHAAQVQWGAYTLMAKRVDSKVMASLAELDKMHIQAGQAKDYLPECFVVQAVRKFSGCECPAREQTPAEEWPACITPRATGPRAQPKTPCPDRGRGNGIERRGCEHERRPCKPGRMICLVATAPTRWHEGAVPRGGNTGGRPAH